MLVLCSHPHPTPSPSPAHDRDHRRQLALVTRLLAPLPTHFRPDYVRACVDTKTVVTYAGLNIDSAADEDRGLRVDGSAMGRVGEPKRRGLKDLYKDLIDPRGMHVPLGNAATGFKHHEADADVAVTFLIFSHASRTVAPRPRRKAARLRG